MFTSEFQIFEKYYTCHLIYYFSSKEKKRVEIRLNVQQQCSHFSVNSPMNSYNRVILTKRWYIMLSILHFKRQKKKKK